MEKEAVGLSQPSENQLNVCPDGSASSSQPKIAHKTSRTFLIASGADVDVSGISISLDELKPLTPVSRFAHATSSTFGKPDVRGIETTVDDMAPDEVMPLTPAGVALQIPAEEALPLSPAKGARATPSCTSDITHHRVVKEKTPVSKPNSRCCREGKLAPRHCALLAFGTLAMCSAGAAALWWVVDLESDEMPAAPPSVVDIEEGPRPVIEHDGSAVDGLEYIIGLNDASGERGRSERSRLLDYLRSNGVTYSELSLIDAIVATLTPELVQELSGGSWRAVQSLERDMHVSDIPVTGGPVHVDTPSRQTKLRVPQIRGPGGGRRTQDAISNPFIRENPDFTSATTAWHLDRIDADTHDGEYNPQHGGRGVDIYIVDTGVRRTHGEYNTRIDKNYYGSGIDEDGHGTAMAGAALGRVFGVAKHATVVDVKVLGPAGGSTSSVIMGLDWIAQNRHASRKSIVSMSLGGPRSPSLDNAVQNLIAKDIPVIVASGNEGSDACDFSPAAVPTAITVGSVGKMDVISSFSNYGSCVDIYAPGEAIRGASHQSDTGISQGSGTSPATAIVAGAAAVFLEAGYGASASTLVAEMISASRRAADTSIPILRLPHFTNSAPSPSPSVRSTTSGCACMPSWTYAQVPNSPCRTSCCNPDMDAGGDWCFVVDQSCQSETWGYCAASGDSTGTTRTPVQVTRAPTTAPTPMPSPVPTAVPTPVPTPSPTHAAVDDAVVHGAVSWTGERVLVGPMLSAAAGNRISSDLDCVCTSTYCNIDLYVMMPANGRWTAVANSRSAGASERLLASVSRSVELTVIAWAVVGSADCTMSARLT